MRSRITATAHASQKMFTYMKGPPSLKKFFTPSMKLPLDTCGAALTTSSTSRPATVASNLGVLSKEGAGCPKNGANQDAQKYLVRTAKLSTSDPGKPVGF